MIQELVVAGIGAVVGVIVFMVGARVWPSGWQRAHEESAGELVLDLVKTFFVAVVAFVVVLGWQQYDNAESHTITEAKGLVGTYWLAHDLPDPAHQRIQGLVRQYTNEVLDREWSLMDREHRLDPAAQTTLTSLAEAVAEIPSADSGASDVRSKVFDNVEQVVQARQDRAADAARSVPEFLMIALYVGTALVLVSPVLSGFRITRSTIMMMALLGVVIGSVLLQIHNLDHPFSGQTVVPRGAFEDAQSAYGQIN
ncbi:DUF4239 domain-containing protein [Nocardia terpenica]|uniref:DUF4239 domain-containing protein n=1 Tax=Nocardia terpenica TaxID=455432 RepID=A0A164JEI9_9NOCA|nr:DUF4239 domain-containing protein [Nocardia terpenica]KZM70327.1 hypothetical protein AWN90_06285 [Nocardia terpenica]MBF6063863.1 DUF4239 domain-containing protein [Nocardia terpenica]MBF6108485.1 DUF4239 domain-containing protein [Nocardia terpenica]MBF6116031.1 DUF4239 domain-containing protein [Nocardia terpenica]MBF6121044.1 DUF4239 domain-containing protein [Nocardia terpenica]